TPPPIMSGCQVSCSVKRPALQAIAAWTWSVCPPTIALLHEPAGPGIAAMTEYRHGAERGGRPEAPCGVWVADRMQDTAYDSGRGGARWRSIFSKVPIPSKGYEESYARVERNGAKPWHSRCRPSGHPRNLLLCLWRRRFFHHCRRAG